MIVFLLIAAGAGLAMTAQLTGMIEYGYAAVTAALAGMVLVAAWSRRDRRRGEQETATPEPATEKVDELDERPERAENNALEAQGDTAEVAAPHEEQLDVAPVREGPVLIGVGETENPIVRVIPGRKRFHQPGCSVLAGRESEELTREEAEEESFTPCSMCCTNMANVRKIV